MNAILLIAARACQISPSSHFASVIPWGVVPVVASMFLGACTALPQPPSPVVLYDLGPGSMDAVSASASATVSAVRSRAALALERVPAYGTLDTSTALHYRLVYANAQQLRPYTQARWSQPPAQLVQQRLSERLGQQRAIVQSRDNLHTGAAPIATGGTAASTQPVAVLRITVEELSHVFISPEDSHGWLRLRATLSTPQPDSAEQLHDQRVWAVQVRAPSADAAGGAQALSQATDQLAQSLEQWVQERLDR